MMAYKCDIPVLDMRSRKVGTINVEIIPCDLNGNALTAKDSKVVINPNEDLLNKNACFMFKINNGTVNAENYDVSLTLFENRIKSLLP